MKAKKLKSKLKKLESNVMTLESSLQSIIEEINKLNEAKTEESKRNAPRVDKCVGL